MKQTQFMVEVVLQENKPLIILRAPNGVIVKICQDPKDVSSFLTEVVENLNKPANSSSAN